MKKLALIFSMSCILFSISNFTFADNPPPCGTLCGLCPTIDIVWQKGRTFETYEFMSPVWASCEGSSNCCGISYTCELYISKKVVSFGGWSCESGVQWGIELPEGFSLGANGSISYNGQTSVTVEGGVKSTCVMGRCQTSNQKVGPYWRYTIQTVPCWRVCYNPKDLQTPCSEYQAPCNYLSYTKSASLLLLLNSCKLSGSCGIPYSGCPQCTNPYAPQCN